MKEPLAANEPYVPLPSSVTNFDSFPEDVSPPSEGSIESLISMGFDQDAASRAFRDAEGDLSLAVAFLVSGS